MSINRTSLVELLTSLDIAHTLYEHPAVFSTKDVERLSHPLPGQDTKNLFLCNEKKTEFVLVCVRADTQVHLKELGRQLGLKGITFGPPEYLLKFLGVTPGSVCLFSLGNDENCTVKGFIDESIDFDELMQNHPLENTATVVLKASDVAKVSEHFKHPLTRITIPVRPASK